LIKGLVELPIFTLKSHLTLGSCDTLQSGK